MGRPRKSIDVMKTCEHCKKVFAIKAWEAKRRDRKYCGTKCRGDRMASFVDEAFFDTPNPQMAYVLGLIITDGCIIKRKSGREFVSVKSIDRQVLAKVNEMMLSEYGIYECGVSSGGNMVYRIDLASDKIVAGVKKWGVTQRKTFTTSFPNLPAEFHVDFVRGVFDGDGSVGYWFNKRVKNMAVGITILGTKALLRSIPAILGVKGHLKPYKKIYSLRIWSHEEVVRTYRTIYARQDAPCLERKKKTFEEALAIIMEATAKPRYGKKKAEHIRSLLGA
jgi:hypothetical protein